MISDERLDELLEGATSTQEEIRILVRAYINYEDGPDSDRSGDGDEL